MDSDPPDFFDRARSVACAVLVAAALAGLIGSMLDWVTIRTREVVPGVDFGRPIEPGQGEAFTGLEARDGWYVAGAALVMFVSGVMLFAKRRSGWAWLAFVCSLLIGAIAIADYRGIGNSTSAISQRMDAGVEARPALGITLVAASGFIGLIASVAGVASTPRRD